MAGRPRHRHVRGRGHQPGTQGELNFKAHMACAERGITHMECLANLESVVGRGRFRFISLPLKIQGSTASPIRAVAVFE